MPLSPAERQQRRRNKFKDQGRISVRLEMPDALYRRLKKMAVKLEISVPALIISMIETP